MSARSVRFHGPQPIREFVPLPTVATLARRVRDPWTASPSKSGYCRWRIPCPAALAAWPDFPCQLLPPFASTDTASSSSTGGAS